MITAVDRIIGSVRSLQARYLLWEGRAVQRFAPWSTRRRWLTLVLVPTLVLCCGGTAIGVPLAWFARETIEAGRGAPSPDAAASSYLMALGYDNQEGLLPVLDDENQSELLRQWDSYRAAMSSTVPPPSRLDFGALDVGPIVGKKAEVTADVSATWWNVGGPTGSYSSESFQWRFIAREDNGWQVSAVEPPTWCGGYVRTDACNR